MTSRAYPLRMAGFRSRFAEWGVDAFLLFNMSNIRYLTGFSGSEGILFVGPNERAHLIVDGRYTIQASKETEGLELVHTADNVESVTALIRQEKAGVVGYEDMFLSVQLFRRIRTRNRGIRFKPLSEKIDLLRALKDDQEVACIRKAANISASALEAILPMIRVGISERDIALELEYRMRKGGAEKPAFDTIVASGSRGALPHARAGSRKLKSGDAVVVDYGAVYKGYHSDETCTFFVERIEAGLEEVYRLVKEAHDRAIDSAVAGRSCREVDRTARDLISEKGWGDHFTHGTGHGVGLDIHEAPRVSLKSGQLLEAGMVLTIEPGIYLPGKWGIRIEDTIRVTKGKAEKLTRVSKELTVLG
ncbi:MAG: Xaa-Pro peptidase family protein [Syntrophales bacterium]|jgi:Xaa-Pro aminopeptidase/Xaa-Pro dipeptidase|nr:Xaa-Pro peptidase family protein [Syntrophales bacterium]